MRVQLLTFPGCPNAEAAREVLQRVLTASRIDARIEEVDTTAPDAPDELRGWGSPTILVNGADAGGLDVPTGTSCRLYRDEDGRPRGTPPEALLRTALNPLK